MSQWIIRFDNQDIILERLPESLADLREQIAYSGPLEILYEGAEATTPIASITADNICYRTEHPRPQQVDDNVFFMHNSIGVSHIIGSLYLASADGVDGLQNKDDYLILSLVDVAYNWKMLKAWYDEQQIFQRISGAEKSGRRVVIHCQHGCQRSPCIMALYLIESGKVADYAEAQKLIRDKRPAANHLALFKPALHNIHPHAYKRLTPAHKKRAEALIHDYMENKTVLFSKRRNDKKEFLKKLKALDAVTTESIEDLHQAHPKAFKGRNSRVEKLVHDIELELGSKHGK